MIYVTQGHEKSIALEVFLKSFSLLSKSEQSNFKLVANKETVIDHLNLCKFEFNIVDDLIKFNGSEMSCIFFCDNETFQSTKSLEVALSSMNHASDILLTLPTSKDQLVLNGINKAGYTEYLRTYSKSENTSMLFASDLDHVLLVTDHIPVCEICAKISGKVLFQKISNALNGMDKYFVPYDEVLIAGINPHVGENGILGNEDQLIMPTMQKLKDQFPNTIFKGPFSGDTLHFHNNSSHQLKVFMYHDQGLPLFKDKNGAVGLNISLGLPFLRMSVDHGTAFDLYGKNQADYLGSLYLLKKGLEAHQKINR